MDMFDTTITESAIEQVIRCLQSRHISEGELVREFEWDLEKRFGYRHGVAVNSGTSALHLALVCAGVGKGDKVILPAQTFVATGLAVLYCGAIPVFADIDVNTGNISVDSVSEKMSSQVRAVICVSWGGNPCELEELEELCELHDVKLIQDNAHALGSTYHNQPLTDWGDFSCFSFQAIKTLTTGDGGLLTCRDKDDYYHARKLRWFGIDRDADFPDHTGERQYNLREIGFKYHMNDLSAALGLGNLENVHKKIAAQRENAEFYDSIVPEEMRIERSLESSCWLYDLFVPSRNEFMDKMQEIGIPTSVIHVGIDRNKIFGGLQPLKNQRWWDANHVCIPCHSNLTFDELIHIASSVKDVYDRMWFEKNKGLLNV